MGNIRVMVGTIKH